MRPPAGGYHVFPGASETSFDRGGSGEGPDVISRSFSCGRQPGAPADPRLGGAKQLGESKRVRQELQRSAPQEKERSPLDLPPRSPQVGSLLVFFFDGLMALRILSLQTRRPALRANLIGQQLGSCWSQQLVCCLRHGGAAGLDGQTGLLRPQISWLYVSRNEGASEVPDLNASEAWCRPGGLRSHLAMAQDLVARSAPFVDSAS